jgi:RNA polymerase sigma-32 factor
MWWIKASIQRIYPALLVACEKLVPAQLKKVIFKLRRTKAEISALEDGNLRPEHSKLIARRLGVQENDVVEVNRRLEGDVSLNNLHDEGSELQDLLV